MSELKPPEGTMPVLETHRFDEATLERYMRAHVAGFRGAAHRQAIRRGAVEPNLLPPSPRQAVVLRRKPPGKLLPSAHAVDREYRVISALAGTGVPVPRTYALCEDPDVIGTSFYIMEYVTGRILVDPRLPGVARAERAEIYDAMNEVLARLHMVDWKAIGLGDFGRPGNYVARQIHRWTTQYRASETETIPSMERLIAWLPSTSPPTTRRRSLTATTASGT